MTILDTVIYIQNNSLWIIFILEGMTASQKDHDRNLPTGMSFPGRQSPVGCRLRLWAMAPEWPAMHMGSNRAQHCLGTGHRTAREPEKGFSPLYSVHQITLWISPCMQGRHLQAAWSWEEAPRQWRWSLCPVRRGCEACWSDFSSILMPRLIKRI